MNLLNKDNIFSNRNLYITWFIIISCFLSFYVVYINNTTLKQDQIQWLPFVDSMFKGTFDFINLWQPKGGHRAAGYITIFLINAKYFGLSMRLEGIFGALSWSASSLFCSFLLMKHCDLNKSSLKIRVLFLFIFTFFTINLSAFSTVLGYSVISLRTFNLLLFFMVFFLLEKNLNTNSHLNLLSLVFLLAFSSLYFGRGWGQAMLVSSSLVLFLIAFLDRTCLGKKIFLLMLCLFLSYAYFNLLPGMESEKYKTYNSISLQTFYDLVNFSTTLLGRALTFLFIRPETSNGLYLIQAVGMFVIVWYALVTFLFFYQRQYKVSWFPFLLLCFSCICVCFVFLGRSAEFSDSFGYGALWPRHLLEVSFGIPAALSITIKSLSILNFSTLTKKLLALVVVLVLTFQVISLYDVVSGAKYIKVFLVKSQNAYFSDIDSFTPQTARQARCITIKSCVGSRLIVDKYNLLSGAR